MSDAVSLAESPITYAASLEQQGYVSGWLPEAACNPHPLILYTDPSGSRFFLDTTVYGANGYYFSGIYKNPVTIRDWETAGLTVADSIGRAKLPLNSPILSFAGDPVARADYWWNVTQGAAVKRIIKDLDVSTLEADPVSSLLPWFRVVKLRQLRDAELQALITSIFG